MEYIYGHCFTLPRLREPSGTFKDPKIDPARLTLEDPCQLKAVQGPSKVQIDQSFFIDIKTTDKRKNTAWFEVNWTSGCRAITIKIWCRPFGLFRVKPYLSDTETFNFGKKIITLYAPEFFLISQPMQVGFWWCEKQSWFLIYSDDKIFTTGCPRIKVTLCTQFYKA